MTATCDYAACKTPARYTDDGWGFCAKHLREHRADLHGERWPAVERQNLRGYLGLADSGPEVRAEHGTEAARRRHQRRGEPACDTCRAGLRATAYPDTGLRAG